MSPSKSTTFKYTKSQTIKDAIELKNIKYKMRAAGTTPNPAPTTTFTSNSTPENLDTFLENETNINRAAPWCKLNKTTKIQKVLAYIQVYRKANNLSDGDETKLTIFLKECLERKKLHKVKEVTYDKEEGVILDIPILVHHKLANRFTLKKTDKRVSTLKSLPSKVKLPEASESCSTSTLTE